MKRFLISLTLLALLAGGFSACKKTIADQYLNPELITTGSISKLFSGMFLNKRIHPSYYDFATFIVPVTGGFTQLNSLPPSQSMYVPSDNYNEARWEDYYDGSMPSAGNSVDYNYNGPGIMNSFREMQTTYAALPAADQANQLVFLQCAKVLFYDQTAQMVDLWGDIPFSKSNSLNTSRSIGYAPFDNQIAIYDTLIAGLQSLNTWFASASLSSDAQSALTTADFVLQGKLDSWRRYANSLRLRLLMRISYYDQTTAQTQVTAMLADPTTYPLISDNTYNVLLNESPTALKSDLQAILAPTGNGNGAPVYAPAYLLDTVMVANGDPRTQVYWDSVQYQPYAGFPADGSTSQYQSGTLSVYDSATFIYNYNVPGVIFTAAEVSFLTAEANERWGAGSTPAATAYSNGINQSIAFYYGINASKIDKTGYSAAVLTPPTQAAIDAYIAGPNIAYGGSTDHNLALIATQNWINFFILQAGQAWAEVRRTGYPVLNFPAASNPTAPGLPTRLLYPSSEKLYNTDSYNKVSAQDTRTTKIFWQVK